MTLAVTDERRAAAARPRPAFLSAVPHLLRRVSALLLHPRRGVAAMVGLVVAFAILWTVTLAILKSGQVLHSDSSEAFLWGQVPSWGSGKHPPFTGWVTHVWFVLFPARDWALYALAMTVTGSTVLLIRGLAGFVTDRRRAVLAALVAMVYPILTFKGYKLNPDVLQLPLVVAIVWIYLVAAERRTAAWGVALGLAGAAACLTKYWGAWPLVAVAVAALLRRDRTALLLSPMPVVALATFALAVAPHLAWLDAVAYAPLRYASQYVGLGRTTATLQGLRAELHGLAMLLPTLVAAALAIGWPPIRRTAAAPTVAAGERLAQLRVMVVVMAVGPLLAAIGLEFWLKSDWVIPLFSLVPLAVLASPRLAVPLRAVPRALAIAVIYAAVTLLLAPGLAVLKAWLEPDSLPARHDVLAAKLDALWAERATSPLRVVVGEIEETANLAFYMQENPRILSASHPELTPWLTKDALGPTGFVAVCVAADRACVATVTALRPYAETLEITTERSAFGVRGQSDSWFVVLAPPEATGDAR
ncbi:glycosyltransferase family 39 protein [Rhodoplanes elegans]|nr:glycosyltransferase family 39 protein [Rhodoplanes elegans]